MCTWRGRKWCTGLIFSLCCLSALQEPVVHATAGRRRAAAAVLVEGFLLGQTCSWVPPRKPLEARQRRRVPDTPWWFPGLLLRSQVPDQHSMLTVS